MITFLQGMVMGIAELIPGISGSTLALTMGIYDDFVNLLHGISVVVKTKLLFLVRKRSWQDVKKAIREIDLKFAAKLLTGTAAAIALFSHLLAELLHNYPAYVYAVFTGIILASLIIPYKALKGITAKETAVVVISFVVMFILFGLTPGKNADPALPLVFFGGIVGITGFFLPGVSGSFILLILGLYEYVIGTVRNATKLNITQHDFIVLLTFIAGLGVGFMLAVKLLRYLLAKQYRNLMAFVAGLLVASIRVLWPFGVVEGDRLVPVSPWELPVSEIVTILILGVIAAAITLKIAASGAQANASLSEESK